MRTVFVCLLVLCSTMVWAQNVTKRPPDELSNRIVVHYESTKGILARGKEISTEHQKLANLISTRAKLRVKNHRPVFADVVRQMISNNWTEAQWRNMKSRSGRQKTTTSFNTSKLSTTVSITVDGDAHQVARILKQLNEDAHLFSTDGFRIIAAEPVKLFYTTLTPNDPRYAAQWAHRVTGTDQAWDTETGNPDVVIAVIDSGVDPDHEDLKDNVYSGSRDFVDVDTQLYENFGYTLIPEEDYIDLDNDPSDYNGHGTHVSGIIGAVGNNGKGVAGVCHSCSIMSLRAGFSIRYDGVEYGTFEDAGIANAIIYATDNGADIINMSFGGQGSLVMKNAVEYAHSRGVVLVAAVGNSAERGALYPAGYDGVIGVAASNATDKLSWSSNFGEGIDLVAPGESIVSTVPVKGGSIAHTTGYRILDGTSMASPYVAGVAGLIKSKNPGWTAEEVIAALISTAKNIDATNPTRISQMGYGRVNASAAVNDSPTPNVVLDDYTIMELTGNQDGHINPGEEISIVLNLRNTWATANAVTATLTSLDPHVTISHGISNYGSISLNENKTDATTPLIFTANASTPDNHVIAFNLAIEYDGKTRNVTINLESFVKETLLVPANYPTIQAAINAASNGDEIIVSPGTYYENINLLGKRIAVVSLYHSMGDRKYIENTIIDGSRPTDPQKASTVTMNSGEDASTLLSGFTIQGGSGTYTQLPENSGYNCFGGGILCLASSPVLKNLIVRKNTLSSSNGGGGGIMISHGKPALENLEIRENEKSAGLYIFKVNNPSKVMVRSISVGKSSDNNGIYISNSNLRLQDIHVEGCTGDVSTGLFLISSTAEVDGAMIHNNNKGVDVRACNRITFRNTVISNNIGDGGIWCTSTDLELINTTVAGNRLANDYGGAGIFITNLDSRITLINSILHGNLWTEHNTGIIRKNQISFLDDGGAVTAAYSNIEGGQAGVKYFNGSSQIMVNWLSGNISSDPLFFKPDKNDYHLSNGSPSSGSGVASFQYNGRVYVDLKAGEFEGDAPHMGAYLFNSPYVRASFSANRAQGNAPLSVQFANESYGFKTSAPDTWEWDFGDGTTSSASSPTHQYNEAGEYTVKLKVR
ncbi:MAG TPA: S8 family serine peptidase, partial [Ohtaekwangia sp.]|nr:S8 family serine peptidase [Ohtaekwangia sp.]